MSNDFFKPRGRLKKNTPGAGVASVIQVPIVATVMSTVDPTHQGCIAVYPSENLDKNAYDSNNWIWVNKLSTYFGQTEAIGPDVDFGAYEGNSSSYGQWNAPPDKLTKVICIFVNGDPNYGFYIGSAPSPETLSMIPAVGSTDKVVLNEGEAQSYAGSPRLPATNINTNNKDVADSTDYLTAAKPVHSYTASIMQQQGILRDKYRGPISTSATRESSSRVGWGVSTPGRPVYQGGYTDESLPSSLDVDPDKLRVVTRRGGHSLVMDDGDIIGRDQLIRLRTALGHQILMSDDGQMLSILHSNGQSYIELGKEGTVDVFSTNSINLRTQGDLNFHADNNINLNAKNVNLNSSENTTLNADKAFNQRVGEDYSLYTLQNIKIKADTALAMEAVGQVGIKSAAEIFNEGTKIHLNDGAASLTPDVVEPIDIIMHPDTLFDETVGWAAALAKIPSITSRAPAHMPWMSANQGADVEVDPSAEASLPAEPSDNLGNLNNNLGDLGGDVPGLTNPTAAATISEVGGISESLDKNVTATLLAGKAAATEFSQFGAAAGTVDTENGPALTLGKFGQTASQMASGGILKPGADTLVNTLVSANAGGSADIANITGSVPTNVLPSASFTGKAGINTAEQFISSKSAQAKSVVSTLQKGQKALQTVGAITGKEAPGGLGAVVSGTMSTGASTGNLGDNVSEVSGAITKATEGGISGAISGATQGVLDTMKAGAESVVASQLSGGVGGVAKALNTLGGALPELGVGIDTNIGASASSFKSIVASFGTLEAGPDKPQDLTAIAGAAAAKVAGASAGMKAPDLADTSTITDALASTVGAGAVEGAFNSATSGVTDAVQGIADQASSVATGAISSAVSDVKSVSSSVDSLTQQGTLQNAATHVQRGATATISSTIASGVSNLPGGQKLGSSIVNNKQGAVNQIADGIGGVTDSLSSLGSSAFSGTDVGGVVAAGESALGAIDSLGSVKDNLISGVSDAVGTAISSALSPGAAAALESALSALTAGGGSTIKLPTVALNTYDRSSITSLIDGVLGGSGSIIPKPNLLGEIPVGALTAASALLSLRKTLSADVKKLNKAQADVASKQRALFEAQSNFPAGSPEIAAAEASYQSAATDPQLKALTAKIETAKDQFGSSITQTVAEATPEANDINPFSEIEQAIGVASVLNQDITTESNTQQPTGDDYRPSTPVELGFGENPTNIYGNEYNNTYSNIIATTTKTFVPQQESFIVENEIVDDGEPVVENTVEAIVSGGTPPTDGQGGVGQNVYIYEGEVGYVATAGYGGGSYWYWDHVGTWKLR